MTHTASELAKRFGISDLPQLAPRYNIAPTQPVLIVRENRHLDWARETTHVVWGLIPPWAKDTKIGFKMINARADTVAEKPAYRHAFKRRRCLVPASGFYEWKKVPAPATRKPSKENDLFACEGAEPWDEPGTASPGSSTSQKLIREPYYIRLRDGELFAFGGLWELWDGPNGEQIESCSVITTTANPLLSDIHDRMPVIIAPENYERWLNCAEEDPDCVADLLGPYPADAMETYKVSSIVNNVRNDEPACAAKIESR
jgi:putative SOS response-associated peptidase YedK